MTCVFPSDFSFAINMGENFAFLSKIFHRIRESIRPFKKSGPHRILENPKNPVYKKSVILWSGWFFIDRFIMIEFLPFDVIRPLRLCHFISSHDIFSWISVRFELLTRGVRVDLVFETVRVAHPIKIFESLRLKEWIKRVRIRFLKFSYNNYYLEQKINVQYHFGNSLRYYPFDKNMDIRMCRYQVY